MDVEVKKEEGYVEYFRSNNPSLRILVRRPEEIFTQQGKEVIKPGIWANFKEGTYVTEDNFYMSAKEIAEALHNSDAFKNGVIWTAAMEAEKKQAIIDRGDPEGPYVCPYCAKIIKVKAGYLNHIRACERKRKEKK